CPHPQLLLQEQRARGPDRGVPRRADRPVGRGVDLRSRRRRADRDRFGVRLLPPGHPAHPPRRHRPGGRRRRRGPVAEHRPGLRRSGRCRTPLPRFGQGGSAVTSPVLIGNCSGFYGDRLSAMREMLEGATEDGRSLDYLTGDYLAELTMLILGRDTFKDPNLGYARTFVRQCEDALGTALERGVKIVSNAGGLNPAGLADKLREVAGGLGLDVNIAHVEGDDLRGKSAELGFTNAL